MAPSLRREPAGLCEIRVRTRIEAEAAVGEVLEEVLHACPASFQEPGSDGVDLSVFLPWHQRPNPCQTKQLRQRLDWLAQSGVSTTPATVRVRHLPDREWRESWKRHFKPKLISDRLLLKPSWSRRKAKRGQVMVILDPGLSFGTGQHPTTDFCLRELVLQRQRGITQSFLDVGTGSGILAIAATKLGYCQVRAFDIDPEAVRVATANAQRNRVRHLVKFRQADLADLPSSLSHRHDLVCANLLAPLLVQERARLCRLVKPGGTLVTAGILAREFVEVDAVFRGGGAQRLRHETRAEWRSAAYRILP